MPAVNDLNCETLNVPRSGGRGTRNAGRVLDEELLIGDECECECECEEEWEWEWEYVCGREAEVWDEDGEWV